MKNIFETHIPFHIDKELIVHIQKILPTDPRLERVDELVEEAKKIANPKALYRETFIDEHGEDFVLVEGKKFNSKILSVNLKDVNKAIAYVITCGQELEKWADALTDPFEKGCVNIIKETVLVDAAKYCFDKMKKNYNLEKASNVNPGSAVDWDLSEQPILFSLLGEKAVAEDLGVYVNEVFFMSPAMSISGFRFATEVTYENCLLCKREDCRGRRVPYDETLAKNKYGLD